MLQDPATLDALGQDLGFSRERVRQREVSVKRSIAAQNKALSNILLGATSQFATQVGEGLQLDDAQQYLPRVLVDAPAGRAMTASNLFLYLAGPYGIWHGLLLRAELRIRAENLHKKLWQVLRRKHTLTIEEADQYAIRSRITSPDVVNKILERIQSEHPHVYATPAGKYVYLPKAADRALRALEERGSPISLGELAQNCLVSAGTLLNAIGNDNRIVRLDRDRYGLTKWSFCEYNGIVGSIHKAIEELGGTAPVDNVAEWVTERFDVEWSSVINFATRHHDFVTSNGTARQRRSDEEPTWASSRELGEVGDCLDIDGCPALRVVIDANLWRGSGQPVPRLWANKAGLSPGHKMNLGTGSNGVTLSWVGSEPTLGSLRTLASTNGWPQDGIGFLILTGNGLKTTWRPLPPEPSQDASKAALAMDCLFALSEHHTGHPLGGAFWMALGARLGLQPLYRVPGMILARLDARREKITDPYVGALSKALLKSEARGLVIQMDI